jgi:uncharacterized protein (TIGR02231 family)
MTEIEAAITDVTVYSDRALVTRRGRVSLDAGEHELRVNNLPQFLNESLRAAGRGPEGTRILNVDTDTAFYSRPPEDELLTLQTQLELLQRKEQLLKARQEALEDRRKWLRALGEQSKDFAKGLAQGQMKPEDCTSFFSFMSDQALQDAEAAQDLDVQLHELRLQIGAKRRELAQKQGSQLADRRAALVTVALPQAGEFELEVSYLAMGASWRPHYDVRVRMNEDASEGTVELTYVGIVQQSTGEAWQDVNLALSTARPSLAAVLPRLDPWYLSVFTPPLPVAPAPARMRMAKMMPTAGSAEGAMQSAAFDEEAPMFAQAMAVLDAPASYATASVEQTGTALLFRVGRSGDIPSDNTPHKTTIARDDLPCSFDYVTAPILEENAHMRGTIVNTGERFLLPGEASIFLGSDYVGTTSMEMTAPGEKFKVFLGIDDSIKVKRKLTERTVDKGSILQSGLRRITYAYEITVHNYRPAPRRVVVRDHLPVPQHERIKVRVLNVQPQPGERTKLELFTWEFALPANGEQKIEYRFVVEHPQELNVVGLS